MIAPRFQNVELIVLGLALLMAVAIDNHGSAMGWIDFWWGSIMVVVGVGRMLFLEEW